MVKALHDIDHHPVQNIKISFAPLKILDSTCFLWRSQKQCGPVRLLAPTSDIDVKLRDRRNLVVVNCTVLHVMSVEKEASELAPWRCIPKERRPHQGFHPCGY